MGNFAFMGRVIFWKIVGMSVMGIFRNLKIMGMQLWEMSFLNIYGNAGYGENSFPYHENVDSYGNCGFPIKAAPPGHSYRTIFFNALRGNVMGSRLWEIFKFENYGNVDYGKYRFFENLWECRLWEICTF